MDHNYYVVYTGFYDPDTDRSTLKDVMGRYRTNLFYEFNKARQADYPPLYTMKESEWLGLPSAYQIYMNSESEYEAAMKLVGSWTHWNKLLKCKPFMNGSEDSGSWTGMRAWREEKEIRNKSLAFNQLKISAAQGNVPAQKLIYEGEKGKAGRPSKAQVTQAAAKQAEHSKSVQSDLERIRHLDARTAVSS